MTLSSPINTNNSSKKIYRPRQIVARKRIAYQELTNQEVGVSQRTASKILKIPRTTFQEWEKAEDNLEGDDEEIAKFFSRPVGTKALHRIIMAATTVINFGGSGVRGVQEFLVLSQLNTFVASSTGAIYNWISLVEALICEFGAQQKTLLGSKMPKRKISIAEDESFHRGVPCLVAIETVSNYILVEKYSKQRTEEEWNRAVREGLSELNVDVVQCTSDEGTAILAHIKNELHAQHSPDLFHVQQELSRATAGPLSKQERDMEKAVVKAESKLKAALGTPKSIEETEKALIELNLKRYGLEKMKTRRSSVKEAIKGLGVDYHPFDLTTGQLQTREKIEEKLTNRLTVVEEGCREACLSEKSAKRVNKANEIMTKMLFYLNFFFLMMTQYLEKMALGPELKDFMIKVLLPLEYLERASKRMSAKEKEKIKEVLEQLRAKAREGPVFEEELEELRSKAKEIISLFQRSSSCVEGRNAWLRMKHDGFHRLSQKKLGAMTVMHNYHIRRHDGTTAAERFFKQPHNNLFEELLKRMPILGKPRYSRGKLVA